MSAQYKIIVKDMNPREVSGVEKWVPVHNKGFGKSKRIRWEEPISVFVNCIPVFTRVKWLRSAFSQFGKVVDAFIPNSSRIGRNGCYGFMRFRERRIALHAIEAMNGSSLCGKRVSVKLASYGWLQRRPREGRGFNQLSIEAGKKQLVGRSAIDAQKNNFMVVKNTSSKVGNMTFSEVVQNTTSPNAPDYFLVGGAIVRENSSWRSNSLV